MHTKAAVTLAALCTLCQPARAAPTYQTIDVPGGTATYISAINDAGTVGGGFAMTGGNHSFIRAADGTITTFDPPGSGGSAVRGIDAAGDVVGVSNTYGAHAAQCFIRSAAGVFTIFGHPKGGTNACYVTSIIDTGYVAGEGQHGPRGSLVSYGFIRSPSGKVTQFLDSIQDGTSIPAGGLNNAGTVVGSTLSGSQAVGFIRTEDGTITTFSGPDAGDTFPGGINDKGAIVGEVQSSGGQSAFVRAPDGAFSTFSVSGANQTLPDSINAKGDVTGLYYAGQTTIGGFVRSAKGDLKTFTVDGGATEAFGINASGVIAGLYSDSQGITHGFIRTP
jgi:hypothetical protein